MNGKIVIGFHLSCSFLSWVSLRWNGNIANKRGKKCSLNYGCGVYRKNNAYKLRKQRMLSTSNEVKNSWDQFMSGIKLQGCILLQNSWILEIL